MSKLYIYKHSKLEYYIMKRDRTLVEARRRKLLDIIMKNESIYIDYAADILSVSQITVRRDLEFLELVGEVERFHGGARMHRKYFQNSKVENNKEKIAKIAASFINDYDSIFINSSSTALKVLSYTNKKNLTIFTNNTRILDINTDLSNRIILIGGEIRATKDALVGDMVVKNIGEIFVNKCFLGCSGLSKKLGVTTRDINQVVVNKAMLKNTLSESYIVCDSSKIGNDSNYVTISCNEIKNIITDNDISSIHENNFKKMNINVIKPQY